MSEPSTNLSRRELMSLVIGAHAAALVGCSDRPPNFAGELLSPQIKVGHRIRDGWRPTVSPDDAKSPDVVIVGGGIAGLTAAWRLLRKGVDDFVLLEIEPVSGGTARGGSDGQFAYPWGAHYLPTPMKENTQLIELLREMNVVVGIDVHGEPIVAEQYLCRDPQERVFVDGQWFEGLYPYHGASDDDLAQLDSFRAEINVWIDRRDAVGWRMFAIPIATASDDAQVTKLDSISMSDWMRQRGWTSERLRWLVDYSCRDDYGLTIDQTSAWAGIFYFASRTRSANETSQDLITWPEGNGAIANYLAQCIGDRIQYSHAAVEIQTSSDNERPTVIAVDDRLDKAFKLHPQQVIFAAPQFLAPYVIRDFASHAKRDVSSFQYGSWLVANVHLRGRPIEHAMPMCWDNVIHASKSLGYVTSTHQTGQDHGPTVITWYYPMTESGPVSRKQLLSLGWSDWSQMIVADLQHAHPDIESLISRIDIMRWGHAMIQPRPGFVWSDARRRASQPLPGIHFANTDLSGVALFEEAFYHGVRAADEVLAAIGHSAATVV